MTKALEQTPSQDAPEAPIQATLEKSQSEINTDFAEIMRAEFGEITDFDTAMAAKRQKTTEMSTLITSVPEAPLEAEETETTEPTSRLRRTLGRFSLSRLGAHYSITKMNMEERKQQLLEKAENPDETLTRKEKIRLAIGRRGLAVAMGAVSAGGIVMHTLALSKGFDLGGSHGSIKMAYETAAVVRPLGPNEVVHNPIFIGGREQGTNDAMAHAARAAGTAQFSGSPDTVYYPGQIRGVGADTITMKDSIDQGTASALQVVKDGDTVYAHSEGSGVARQVAQQRPNVRVITNSDPYTGLLAADGPAAAIKKPLEGIFGIPVGIKGGPNVTSNVDEFDALAGASMINPDKTFNPVKTFESVIGTAAGGRHGLDRLNGTPIETRVAADGTTINIHNKGTGVKSGITGQEFQSPISASLKQHQNIDIGPLDGAIVAARGDKDGNVDVAAVGNAVAPGLGDAIKPLAQPFVDAVKPLQAAVINGVNQATNPGSAPIVKTSGGTGGNTLAATAQQLVQPAAPAANKAPAPVIPNMPTPQQFQADPIGTGMGLLGTFLGGGKK